MQSPKKDRSEKKSYASLPPGEAFKVARLRISKLTQDSERLDLSGLKQLRKLPDEIGRLRSLRSLELRGTQVVDLACIADLRNLESLELTIHKLKDIRFLSKLTSIKALDLSGTAVEDFRSLNGLLDLTYLNISYCSLASQLPLARLPNLTTLKATRSGLRSLEGIQNSKNLENLLVENTDITSLNPIRGLFNIKHLGIDGLVLTNLSVVEQLASLEVLSAAGTHISDLSPLSGAKALRNLDISNTNVASLYPISRLRNLTHLSINNTPIKDLGAIESFDKLINIKFDGSGVSDPSVLLKLASFVPDSVESIGYQKHYFSCDNSPASKKLPLVKFPDRLYNFYDQAQQTEFVEKFNHLRRMHGLKPVKPKGYQPVPGFKLIRPEHEQIEDAENSTSTTDVLAQRPATYGFALRNGKIEAELVFSAPSFRGIASEVHLILLEKASAAKDRFIEANVPRRLIRSIESILNSLGKSIDDVAPGKLLMSFRSIEADCSAYDTESARRELPEDTMALLKDLTTSLEDLMGCYPELANIEAERVAQRIKDGSVAKLIDLMKSIKEVASQSDVVSPSSVEALGDGEAAIIEMTDTISSPSVEEQLHIEAIKARAKLVGQKLLDYRNFAASALRYLMSKAATESSAILKEAGGLGRDTWSEVRKKVPKAVATGIANSSRKLAEAATIVAVTLLVARLSDTLVALGVLVASFIPLGERAKNIQHEAIDASED